MNPEAKRHIISAIITFASGFSIALGLSLTELIGTTITYDIVLSIIAGAALTGIRTMFKYLNETYIK